MMETIGDILFAILYFAGVIILFVACIGCILGAIGVIFGLDKSDEPDIVFTITFEPKDHDEDSKETK